jgi:Rho-binding antiterminator
MLFYVLKNKNNMEIRSEKYRPINCDYYDVILEKATIKSYCKIQYFSELHEFITTNAVIKDVFTKSGEEFMLLATGEVIRLDRLVSINGELTPHYARINDFSCDC